MATNRPRKTATQRATRARTKARAGGRRARAKPNTLARLREICLSFPEAHEVEAWGEPTFRVKNKLFAMHASASTHHGNGRPAVWINATHLTQDLLVRTEPERYFRPPYVGVSGWVAAWLDRRPDWNAITQLLRDGYRQRAPKKLADQLDEE
ncbi:MAG TPA: MmcQ/YjbR family DNA-binding protein [Gemmatimonadaceae bacterium]